MIKMLLPLFLATGLSAQLASTGDMPILEETFESLPEGDLKKGTGPWTHVINAKNGDTTVRVVKDQDDAFNQGTENKVLELHDNSYDASLRLIAVNIPKFSASFAYLSFDVYEFESSEEGALGVKLGSGEVKKNENQIANGFVMDNGKLRPGLNGLFQSGKAFQVHLYVNESGKEVKYEGPSGRTSKLAPGKMDLWIDKTPAAEAVDVYRAATAPVTLESLRFETYSYSKQKVLIDNIRLMDLGQGK